MSDQAGYRELKDPELSALEEQMLEQDDVEVIAEFFKALADPTRVRIVNALQCHEGLCVTDLAKLLGLTKSALSHQLSYMRINKLVRVYREGKRAFYALDDEHVRQMFDLATSHVHHH